MSTYCQGIVAKHKCYNMLMASYKTARTRVPALRQIGTWATWWWAITGLYVLALVWQGKSYYGHGGVSLSAWLAAIHSAFNASLGLQFVLLIVIFGWVTGGWVWLRELKRQKVSYREAFKDLFLTIRK